MLSPKPKSILDTMASQLRSKLSIPDDPVIALPGKSKKTKPKPDPATASASVSFIVETISTEDTVESAPISNDAITLVGDSGETVPASRKVAQVDITREYAVVTSESVPHTFNPVANNNDDTKDAPVDMKLSPFDTNKNYDDDADDDNNHDDDDDDTISGKQASLNCSFLFESSTSSPGLADKLNGSYDLSFRSNKLFTNPGVLTASPTRSLRRILSTLLDSQATATRREALVPSSFDLSIPSRASIVNVITSNLPFKAHNGRSVTLI